MSTNYVDNKRLYDEIVLWRNACAVAPKDDPPEMPAYIGEAFTMMAERISGLPQFSAYSFRDELVADAVFTCLKYLHSFNPEYGSNPFSYFTRTIYNAFSRKVGNEYEHIYVRDSLYVDFMHSTHVSDAATEIDGTSRELVKQAHERMNAFEGWKERKRKKRTG